MDSPNPPAARTVQGEDLWETPGRPRSEQELREELWKVPWKASSVSLFLAGFASLAIVSGGVFLLLLYYPTIANFATSGAGLSIGGRELFTLIGAVVIAAGVILAAIGGYLYRRTISDFQRQVDLFRREGLATVQAMEAMRSSTRQR